MEAETAFDLLGGSGLAVGLSELEKPIGEEMDIRIVGCETEPGRSTPTQQATRASRTLRYPMRRSVAFPVSSCGGKPTSGVASRKRFWPCVGK
ncbi:hypothetical protein OHT76_07815 [Streptomyces sp. NBC_00287]|uniref:hypothetical protein n=1 Tax=Streptomyces sp. NBC_00287 TaxID=2975702 RepID=UPI002E2ABD94|nr:hypothetical protein [Streptomyces sp. NBC_00287]